MPLQNSAPEKWIYKEHTKVKHEILAKYLSCWIRILGSSYKRVCYFDCFAGRGEYTDGSPGSPLIAIRKAGDLKKKFSYLNEIVCVFIEKNEDNYENLKSVIENEKKMDPEKYKSIKTLEINDEFANVFSKIIAEIKKDTTNKLPPSFFFIDPFGFKGVPFNLIKNILSFQKTEVFISFMVRDVNRFLDSPKHKISIEELYGIKNVRKELSEKYGKMKGEDALLALYRECLHREAHVKYTFPFKINMDKIQQTTYYLIHATNHPKGCELMKEIMFKAGTEGRFGYLGPAEGQMALTRYEDLSEFLMKHFKGRTLSYRDIIHETLMDTPFVKKHYHEALKRLYKEGKVLINGLGSRGGLPDDAKITFL